MRHQSTARRTGGQTRSATGLTALGAIALLLLSACQTSPRAVRDGPPVGAAEPEAPIVAEERGGLIVSAAENHTVRPETREVTPERVAQLNVPSGFRIQMWAEDLEQPRGMVAAPNGDVYVAERRPGRVTLLRDTNGDGEADHRQVVAEGLREDLRGVHDLAIHQGRLYMVTETELYSAEIRQDGTLGERRLITDRIPAGGQHPNRTIGFNPQGELFLSIGSTCNACVEPMEEHATILRVNTQTGELMVYAEGLRNTIGFGWHPQTGQLWGFDHNSDGRGNDWPPEELNRIQQGRHYGWPWCGGNREIDWQLPADPDDMTREQFCRQTEPPVLTYQGHAAPMQMVFYRGDMFPQDYRNDVFVTMRGSWNRNPPVGYEVVRVRFDAQGNPTRMESFANGWLIEDGRAHFGRLMGLTVARDGSLLIGDDENGVVYRVSYTGGR